MSYYTSIVVDRPYETVVSQAREALAAEGFGVITEIDVRETMRKKLDRPFRNYVILGACNPPLAYEALAAEDKVGVLLPCNVVVQEIQEGAVEVAAMDPVAAMDTIGNDKLTSVAAEVGARLARVLESLSQGSRT